MKLNEEYLVSVYMTTYFHEKYIKQAIESVLSQKVNFKYEIIICDDASKDSTPDILTKYAQKYDFVKVFLNKENIGLTANAFMAKTKCTGKYIVPLSGDDYWIDNNKLQKQVDFLEKNSDYIGVVSRIEARSDFSDVCDFVVPVKRRCNKVVTLKDYLKGKNFPTNGLMIRNVIEEKYDLFSIMPKVSKYIDDITDCMLILMAGDVYITDDVTVAYRRRISVSGEHNFNSINNSLTFFKKYVELLKALDVELDGKYDLINRYKREVSRALFKCYRPFKKVGFMEIYKDIPQKYRKRFLMLRSILFMLVRAAEIIERKIGF